MAADMRLIADTHVHFYPCYDLQQALNNLRRNLSTLNRNAVCMAFLAERHDCHFFRQFGERGREMLGADIQVQLYDNALLFSEEGYPDLYFFAGRQIITRERIEVLALTTDMEIEDGLPVDEVVSRVTANGGIPVISWAPGKWFFQRKKVVESLLDRYEPGTILFGDTTLRPTGWLEPDLMKKAVRQGFGLVAGSDPLPFKGEEVVMGRYAVRLEADFDADDPVASIRSLFTRPKFTPARVGRRGRPLETLFRLFQNARSKNIRKL